MGQPGYPQPGYPQPGYQQGFQQQGFQQPPFPAPPGPPKSRTGLIVGIVVAAVVVLGGGGTAAFLLSHKSAQPDQRVGRYTTQTACPKLNAPPYTFTTTSPSKIDSTILQDLTEDCTAKLDPNQPDTSADVTVQTYLGPGGLGVVERNPPTGGQTVSGNGFESPVNVAYASDSNSQRCVFRYSRSNETVRISFFSMAGVHDQATCLSLGLPLAKQLYRQIG